MASKAAEETTPALNYKTWVLKVSIHCEGCKRKVKKVLQSIDGVYTTSVDSQNHKVIVTGNVEAETLVKKLLKSGKHAEIMTEEKKEKKQGKDSKDSKDATKGNSDEPQKKKSEQKKKETETETTVTEKEKAEGTEQPNKAAAAAKAASTPAKKNTESAKNGGKSDKKKPENLPTPAAGKKDGENGGGEVEKSDSGNGGKKKGKKGQNSNANANVAMDEEAVANVDVIPATNLSPPTPLGPAMFPMNPIHQSHYQQPYPYPQPYCPPPVYAVNYNTAYPTTSYGGSYYAPPSYYAPSESPSYVDPHAPPSYYAPSESPPYVNPHARRTDSFEMFSDENANGCWIM